MSPEIAFSQSNNLPCGYTQSARNLFYFQGCLAHSLRFKRGVFPKDAFLGVGDATPITPFIDSFTRHAHAAFETDSLLEVADITRVTELIHIKSLDAVKQVIDITRSRIDNKRSPFLFLWQECVVWNHAPLRACSLFKEFAHPCANPKQRAACAITDRFIRLQILVCQEFIVFDFLFLFKCPKRALRSGVGWKGGRDYKRGTNR